MWCPSGCSTGAQSQLAQAQAKVYEILDDHERPGVVFIKRIREWFAYYDRLDVTTMLELAIWRVNINGNELDAEARQASRKRCGNDMSVIIPGVLEYLDV